MVENSLDILGDSHRFWWQKKVEGERHSKIVQLVERIYKDQDYIRSANMDHLRSYSKRDYYDDDQCGNVVSQGPSAYLGINATRSGIDTIVAKVTQQDPRGHFKTEGGNWHDRHLARKLQKFIDGLFYETDFYPKLRRVFKDAAVFGTGFLKPHWDGKKICWDRVYPGSVIVDEASAMNGNTKSMFQIENVPVESLTAKFPKKANDILTSNMNYRTTRTGTVTTLVRVYEAWHLPDINGNGGRHVICTDSHTLLDEEYKEDFEPIFAFHWSLPLAGYYGHGAVEDVAPLQEEMDYIMQRIQTATHNAANVWLLKPASCEVPNSNLTNKMVSIIEYDGPEPPQFYHSKIMDQQVFDHVRWLNELIYNVTGVSAMSATSQKPKGIESGKALQTMLDVESQRFAEVQKNYENAVVKCIKIALSMAKAHFTGGKSDYSVRVDNGKFTDTVKWSDVCDLDEYVLKVWPTNMLPQSPSGRMEWVERMMQAGLIDALTGMMLLDFPDVEAQQSLMFSSIKQALWIVDQVIYEDKDVEPKEWYDLQRCIKYMQMGMANAEMEGAPEEVMERGLDFIAKCEELLIPPEPPMPPEPDPTTTEQLALADPKQMEEAMAMENAAQMPPPGMPPQGVPQ